MENLHFVIENKSLSTKSSLIKNILIDKHVLPTLKDKKGLLFSNSILEKFIEKEVKHGIHVLTTKENRSIRSFSSGEQKIILLNYLIDQKPDYLILESPFESLDISTVSYLKEKFIKLS